MNQTQFNAQVKLVLHAIVNVAGNGAIIALLPQILPAAWVAVVFLAFNLVQVILAYIDPSYTVHLIQAGKITLPPHA